MTDREKIEKLKKEILKAIMPIFAPFIELLVKIVRKIGGDADDRQ